MCVWYVCVCENTRNSTLTAERKRREGNPKDTKQKQQHLSNGATTMHWPVTTSPSIPHTNTATACQNTPANLTC